jgi:hypothetical protein
MLLIFARDQYEQYRFLGATQQSYFIAFQSELAAEQSEASMLVIRHYRLDTLALLNEQIVSVPMASDSRVSVRTRRLETFRRLVHAFSVCRFRLSWI